MGLRRDLLSGTFSICFYLFIFLFVFPYMAASSSLEQETNEKQPPFTEAYSNEQFKISFDYPEGCSLLEKKGFLKNLVAIKVSCSNDKNTGWIYANLVKDNFMPGYDFKELAEYLLGFGHHADGVSGSQYVSPFNFSEFVNTAGMKGYKVTFSIVKETYTEGGTITETSPRNALAYDLGGNNGTRLRAILFNTSSDYMELIADTFRIIE